MSLIPLGVLAASGAQPPTGTFDLIETFSVTSPVASITFSNLAQYASSYRHLQLRLSLRSNNSALWEEVRVIFNSSSTGYYSHAIFGYEASPPIGTYDDGYGRAFSSANGNTAPSGIFGASIIDILDSFSSSKNKVMRTLGGRMPTSNENRIALSSASWANTNAITTINISPVGGTSWLVGSRISLYGIKG